MKFEDMPPLSEFIEDGVIDVQFEKLIGKLNADIAHCLDSQNLRQVNSLRCPIEKFLEKIDHMVKNEVIPVKNDRVSLFEFLEFGLEECAVSCTTCPALNP